jgi:hypothetical protein
MTISQRDAVTLEHMTWKSLSLLVYAGVLLLPGLAAADAIMRTQAMNATTIAEFAITRAGIVVELEIGGVDLSAFRNLLPDDVYEQAGNPPRPLAKRLADFFVDDLPIVDAEGKPLPGVLLEIAPRDRARRDPITGEVLPATEAQPERVVFAKLGYAFEALPESLVFSGPPSTGVGFVVYHEGVAVNDFRYLGRGAVLDLDWADPWFSRFRMRSLVRQYSEPMSGFIYIEPYEVRKEIVVRPVDLQHWVDLGLAGLRTIPVDIQPEVKRRAAEYLRAHHPVEIDGVEVEGDLARVHFLERTLKTSRVIDPAKELDIFSAVLGVIFVYPTDGLPQRVSMEWDLWNEQINRVPAVAVDQAGPMPSFLDPEYRVLEWQNFLKNPQLPTLVAVMSPPSQLSRSAVSLRWLALAFAAAVFAWTWRAPRKRAAALAGAAALSVAAFWLASAATVDGDRSSEVVQGLLHNIYRAFDYRDEEAIYDVLARSVSGDLLEQIYLETRRGLELASQGGARAKVKQIELVELDARAAGGGAFFADATWNVAGSVGHWGHVHTRRNRVRARLTVGPVDGAWKLTGMEVLEEERL